MRRGFFIRGVVIGINKLPDIGTADWEKLKADYPVADDATIWLMSDNLKYSHPDAFKRAMKMRGVYRDTAKIEYTEQDRHPIVELPPVEFHKYVNPSPRKKGDEEIAILHITDGHGGKITNSFNDEIYKSRMEQVYHNAMRIVSLHRNMYPIKKLIILDTGDNGQGENPYQGSKIGEVSMGARDQIKKLVAPTLNNLIGTFKHDFKEVEFHGVPGNHGKEKLAPETSSYDLLLYDILEAGIGKYKGINIFCHDEWGAIIEINGHRCFVFHGDGIPSHQGIPFFALDRKLKSWHMQYGGFRYSFSGHFHMAFYHEVSSKLEHFNAGSIVSDDEWALKKMGISSAPSQSIYGIHPKQGITWHYLLKLE